jgi:hypothetical protein
METRRPLPDNDQALAGIARVGLQEWLDNASAIRPYFHAHRGKLHQKRCDDVLDTQDKRASTRSEVGRKGAEARHKKINGVAGKGMPKADPKQADGTPPANGEHTNGVPAASQTPASTLLHDKRREEKREDKKIHTLPAAEILSPAPARGPVTAAAQEEAVKKVQALFDEMNNPNIVNFRFVYLWLEQGADVDLDILPAIRETTRRQLMESPDWYARSLKFYDGAVQDWVRQRTALVSTGFRVTPKALGYDPKEAIAAGTAAADARLKDDQ